MFKINPFTGKFDWSLPLPVFDTQANILALTPSRGQMAIATDTLYPFIGDGTNWHQGEFPIQIKPATPDMGYPYTDYGLNGYAPNGFSAKRASQFSIGGNDTTTDGAVRTINGTFQVYLNGTWNDIVMNFRFREDSGYGYSFEHMPIGFTEWIEVMSGNSVDVGLNGLPLIQNYMSDMGAYPTPIIIDGGTL